MVQRITEWVAVVVFAALVGVLVAGTGELKRQVFIIQEQQLELQEYEKLFTEYAAANQGLAQGLFQCLQASRGKGDYQF